MPSILKGSSMYPDCIYVLNLVISGMPSIPDNSLINTIADVVLNLVISGMPSILRWHDTQYQTSVKF